MTSQVEREPTLVAEPAAEETKDRKIPGREHEPSNRKIDSPSSLNDLGACPPSNRGMM